MSVPEPDLTKFSPETSKPVLIERQTVTIFLINTAIYLWFRELDMISPHALAAAAIDILRGVGRKKAVESHVFNKEMEKLLGKKLRMPMNFFKHANTDPNEMLKFYPDVTELWLIDAAQMYGKIYGSLTPLMHTFRAWFAVFRGGGKMLAEDLQKFLPEGVFIEDLVSPSRPQFMEEILPLFVEDEPPPPAARGG